MGNRGKLEFIQVLRPLEALPKDIVNFTVAQVIRLGDATSNDPFGPGKIPLKEGGAGGRNRTNTPCGTGF